MPDIHHIHPLIAVIADDDPDVQKALLSIRKPLIPAKEIFASGPWKKSKAYDDINSGLLVTHTICGRRFAYALDFAKYIVALERRDKAEGRVHVLAASDGRKKHHRHAAVAA